MQVVDLNYRSWFDMTFLQISTYVLRDDLSDINSWFLPSFQVEIIDISADPPDINILPEYHDGNDFQKLIESQLVVFDKLSIRLTVPF